MIMARVIGFDPGTVTVDICGLDDGALFLEQTIPTADALASPETLVDLIAAAAPLDLVAGPSGYGLPCVLARDLREEDLRLACLSSPGEAGGIGGLGALLRALRRSPLPVMLTPGVVHLPSVPLHRKVNRIDMGTADKVCAVALAVQEQSARRRCDLRSVSLILLELGGAFTAAIAVEGGAIVDGAGGTSGAMGARAAGALDGEVAFVAGAVSKRLLFNGGAAAVAGGQDWLEPSADSRARVAWDAYVEGVVKAVAAMLVSVPAPFEIVLSGRLSQVPHVREALVLRVAALAAAPVRPLAGFGRTSTHAAQGAALVADGLAGGRHRVLVEGLRIREASGTVLDHLYVVSREDARRRLGIQG